VELEGIVDELVRAALLISEAKHGASSFSSGRPGSRITARPAYP